MKRNKWTRKAVLFILFLMKDPTFLLLMPSIVFGVNVKNPSEWAGVRLVMIFAIFVKACSHCLLLSGQTLEGSL